MTLLAHARLPVAVVGAIAFSVVVLLYTVRWRLRRRLVSTVAFWTASRAGGRGAGRLGAIEQILSMLLQLAVVSLLVGAALQPRFSCQSAPGRAVAIVLDRSMSMGAMERIEPRIETARRRVLTRLADSAPNDTIALVLGGGTEPAIASPLTTDVAHIARAVGQVSLRPGPSRLKAAVELACALVADHQPASLVVFTDRSEPVGECPGVEWELVSSGTQRENLGITAFSAQVAPHDRRHAEAYLEVVNAGRARAKAVLHVDLDGSLMRVKTIDLPGGASMHAVIDGLPLTAQGRLEAHLSGISFEGDAKDALPDDDHAFALEPRRNEIAIDLAGRDPALELALTSNPRYAVKTGATEADVHVVVGEVPVPTTRGRWLLVGPRGPNAPVIVQGTVTAPHLTFWKSEHQVLRRLVLEDVVIERASRVRLPARGVALAGAEGAPLVWTIADEERRVVGLSFELEATNLPLRVSFPVLIYNAIDWLLEGRSADARSFLVRAATPVTVVAPGGAEYRLEPTGGLVVVEPKVAGFYTTKTEGRVLGEFAMSVADAHETELEPKDEDVAPTATAGAGRVRDRDASMFLLAGAILLLLLEWFTFQRRKTV